MTGFVFRMTGHTIFTIKRHTCHPELVSGSANYVFVIPPTHSINSDIEFCNTHFRGNDKERSVNND